LLESDALVNRNQDIAPSGFAQLKQFAIPLAAEPRVTGSMDIMARICRRNLSDKHSSRRTFMHAIRARKEFFASASASIAMLRLTVGKSSRNSARGYPPST
jgi:hypothetical protein